MTNHPNRKKHQAAIVSPDWLREARESLGLSQRAMADALKTPLRTYEDWEAGRRRAPGIVEVALRGISADS